jgi:hypothetical protein
MGKSRRKARNFGNELTGSLKEQPLFDGYGPASPLLTGGQCVKSTMTPESLENALKLNELTGSISRNSVSGNEISNYGSMKRRRRSSKKIKKLHKKIRKSLKKINKLKMKKSKRKFGLGSGSLEQNTKLGLPSYETNPSSIYNNDYLIRGARPPIPYGPVDNARMSMLTQINGFGTRTEGLKSRTEGSSRTSSRRTRTEGSKSRTKSRFGQTPGSSDWHIPQETALDKTLASYAQPYLAQAKGMFLPDIQLYGKADQASYLNQYSVPSFNVPMQYSNNQYNYPVVNGNSFGRKRSFGAMTPLSNMYGPNNVGHESQIPMYHAGSTTLNFADNQLYSPIGMVGGPTNSTGSYASVGTSPNQLLKVLPDGMTPNAYLSTVGFGKKSKMSKTRKGSRFGELVANISSIANGSGLLTLAQPLPSYLDKNREVAQGDYVSFGKKKKPKCVPPVPKHEHNKKPKLVPKGQTCVSKTEKSKERSKTSFGKSTSTLTLNQTGTVNITKNPV